MHVLPLCIARCSGALAFTSLSFRVECVLPHPHWSVFRQYACGFPAVYLLIVECVCELAAERASSAPPEVSCISCALQVWCDRASSQFFVTFCGFRGVPGAVCQL
jgi:hypothetical protein